MVNWIEALGRERSATDQPPGTYRYRAGRGCPWQPLRILWDGYHWHVLLLGKPVPESGRSDPLQIPFIRDRAPFHPITITQYYELMDEYGRAGPGSPLLMPDMPVDLRAAPALRLVSSNDEVPKHDR